MELETIETIQVILDTNSNIEYENAAKNNADPIVRRFFSELIIFEKELPSKKLPKGITRDTAIQKFIADFYIRIQNENTQKWVKQAEEEMSRLSEEIDNF